MSRHLDLFASVPSTLATGLRQKLQEGDRADHLRADVMAGLLRPQVVEVVARAGLVPERGRLALAPGLDAALSLPLLHSVRRTPARAPSSESRA